MNSDIDKLSSRELQAAIEQELGVRAEYRAEYLNAYSTCVDMPYYSDDIGDAWELDDPDDERGYDWTFRECRDYNRHQNYVLANACDGRQDFYGQCDYNGKAEKPRAYAVARCRCWLKARQAKKGE